MLLGVGCGSKRKYISWEDWVAELFAVSLANENYFTYIIMTT